MILRKSTVTVLGVTIDEALSFNTLMESVCSKAAGRLRLLFRTARRLPTRYRASLARALRRRDPKKQLAALLWRSHV